MGAWAYSVVTAMELFAGADNNREIGRIDGFLASYREIRLSEIADGHSGAAAPLEFLSGSAGTGRIAADFRDPRSGVLPFKGT